MKGDTVNCEGVSVVSVSLLGEGGARPAMKTPSARSAITR